MSEVFILVSMEFQFVPLPMPTIRPPFLAAITGNGPHHVRVIQPQWQHCERIVSSYFDNVHDDEDYRIYLSIGCWA